jgi:four helix bundle protein
MEGDERRGAKNYRELVAWQKAMDLVTMVYDVTQHWPKTEVYGLTNQIRRAAVSIPSNIAEGQGRASTKEFLHHLSMARGSLRDVGAQLLIAQRLGYTAPEAATQLLAGTAEAGRLLNGLYRSLDRS